MLTGGIWFFTANPIWSSFRRKKPTRDERGKKSRRDDGWHGNVFDLQQMMQNPKAVPRATTIIGISNSLFFRAAAKTHLCALLCHRIVSSFFFFEGIQFHAVIRVYRSLSASFFRLFQFSSYSRFHLLVVVVVVKTTCTKRGYLLL